MVFLVQDTNFRILTNINPFAITIFTRKYLLEKYVITDVTRMFKFGISFFFFLLLFRRKKKQKLVKNAHFRLFTFRW
jgi:hypothetical protein